MPPVLELDRVLKLVQEVVAVEVGATIHENPVFGIELPDGIASPVVVNEDVLRIVGGAQERDRVLRKLRGFRSRLVAGQADPLDRLKIAVQLLFEMRRLYETRPWTTVELTIAPPEWRAEPK